MAVSLSVGCQTQMAGMTLPSGRYLEHFPQYFPPDPDFPLPRELAYQEETAGLLNRKGPIPTGVGVGPVPPVAVPPPPVMPPGAPPAPMPPGR